MHLQPILRYFYHQIYHVHNKNDCIGENSICRCILIKESHEIRHVRNLQKAILDLNLDARYRSIIKFTVEINDFRFCKLKCFCCCCRNETIKTDNSSSKAYQTIKCKYIVNIQLILFYIFMQHNNLINFNIYLINRYDRFKKKTTTNTRK